MDVHPGGGGGGADPPKGPFIRGDKATPAAEILRQQDQTRRRMGEPEEELRTALGAVELRADQDVVFSYDLQAQSIQRSTKLPRKSTRRTSSFSIHIVYKNQKQFVQCTMYVAGTIQ